MQEVFNINLSDISDEELAETKNELPKQQIIEGMSTSIHNILKSSNPPVLKQIDSIMNSYNILRQEKDEYNEIKKREMTEREITKQDLFT